MVTCIEKEVPVGVRGKHMDRRIIYGSFVLNVALVVWLAVALTPEKPEPEPEPEPVDLTIYTQQDLSKLQEVKLGMTSGDLIKLMGRPAIREFNQTLEEWHYCKTGSNVDEYIVLQFQNDKVVSSRNYTVSWLDVVYYHTQSPTEALIKAGGMGDCKLTAKWGTYPLGTLNKPSKEEFR